MPVPEEKVKIPNLYIFKPFTRKLNNCLWKLAGLLAQAISFKTFPSRQVCVTVVKIKAAL